MYFLFLLVFLSCLDLPYPGRSTGNFCRHSPSSRKAVTPISFLKDSFAGLDTSSFGTWKTFCRLPGRRPALPYRLNRPPLTAGVHFSAIHSGRVCSGLSSDKAVRRTGASSGVSCWAPSSTSMELRVRCRTREVSSHYPPESCSPPCSLLLRDAEDRPARGRDGSGSCVLRSARSPAQTGPGSSSFFISLPRAPLSLGCILQL